MDLTPPSDPSPPQLPPGTVLGSWRLVALAGGGVHGEVYRAVRAHEPDQAPPVALKLARRAWDARFLREARLLSLARHPSVPGLVDQGSWRPEGGAPHPFIVMDWIDGEPLYDWAQRQAPTSKQVLRLLLQLAQALEVLHAKGGVHRDVKGANILVRRKDGRAMLTDFGSGVPPGASTLTPPRTFVGTPAYRSAESWLFDFTSLRQPDARYTARPADDVFSLGITACRLLTGHYPEPDAPSQDKSGTWSIQTLVLPPSLQNVEPPLRTLVLSMLALRPEQHPTASQLVHSLEQALGLRARPRLSPRFIRASLGTALALTSVSLCLTTWAWWSGDLQRARALAAAGNQAAQEDGSTAALAEALSSVSKQDSAARSSSSSVAEEPLPEPQPGQLRTDSKGLCPRPKQFPLNGACWAQNQYDRELCAETHGQMYKGLCYQPITSPGHLPTSSPKPVQGDAQ